MWHEREWLASPIDVLTSLQLNGLVASLATVKFRLLVVSRSWTRFSGMEAYDSRAAWISWTRLRKLVIQHRESTSPLGDAWPELCSPKLPRSVSKRISTTSLPDLTLHFELPKDHDKN